MFKSVLSKVAWVGRTASMVFGLALVLALIFGVATVALGATGGNFILGKANSAGATSKLTSAVAGPTLSLINNGTSAAATALNLSVPSGRAPLTVNPSAGKATNLNADQLDGIDSGALGVTMKTNTEGTHICTGMVAGVWSECAPVTVTVPAGKQYQVTVWSSFAAVTLPQDSATTLFYCPARRGGPSTPALTCITPNPDSISLASNYAESGASSAEITVPAGTYTFSTALKPETARLAEGHWVQTTVMVRDVSAPGPSIN